LHQAFDVLRSKRVASDGGTDRTKERRVAAAALDDIPDQK
jgi:hypothetical protein